jgi:tellurite resistance protein TerC
MIEITPWHWAGFIVCILFLVALDLGLWEKRKPGQPAGDPGAVGFRRALLWSGLWLGLALLFAAGLNHWRGRPEATQFLSGYLIEWSLSLDNVLVIALIFSAFRLSPAQQHRALFLGVLGAVILRGAMIGLGAVLIHQFHWLLYVFGGFLVITGVKMVCWRAVPVPPEQNRIVRWVRRFFPVAADFDGLKLVTLVNQRRALTPLALVVVLVESSDLIFALDSVPAVFSVTRDAFIVFTSNLLAILGLRSLYFLLAGALDYFRHLKLGLSVVLLFVGAKMLLEPHGRTPLWFQCEIPNGVSLLTILSILALAMAWSVAAAHREKRGSP